MATPIGSLGCALRRRELGCLLGGEFSAVLPERFFLDEAADGVGLLGVVSESASLAEGGLLLEALREGAS